MVDMTPAIFGDEHCTTVSKITLYCTYDTDDEKIWLQEHVQTHSCAVEIKYIPRYSVQTTQNFNA